METVGSRIPWRVEVACEDGWQCWTRHPFSLAEALRWMRDVRATVRDRAFRVHNVETDETVMG